MKTDELLTATEVAALAGVMPATVRSYARQGTMPAPVILRPGRRPRLRWRAQEVREWLGGVHVAEDGEHLEGEERG
jgi:predicted DNA-binding transcriptional regulator AlpA